MTRYPKTTRPPRRWHPSGGRDEQPWNAVPLLLLRPNFSQNGWRWCCARHLARQRTKKLSGGGGSLAALPRCRDLACICSATCNCKRARRVRFEWHLDSGAFESPLTTTRNRHPRLATSTRHHRSFQTRPPETRNHRDATPRYSPGAWRPSADSYRCRLRRRWRGALPNPTIRPAVGIANVRKPRRQRALEATAHASNPCHRHKGAAARSVARRAQRPKKAR